MMASKRQYSKPVIIITILFVFAFLSTYNQFRIISSKSHVILDVDVVTPELVKDQKDYDHPREQAQQPHQEEPQSIITVYYAAAAVENHQPQLFNIADKEKPLKMMLYITTHMSEGHYWYLKACWELALQNSLLLRSTDVVVYISRPTSEEQENQDVNEERFVDALKHTFRNQNLTIHYRDNPGYQEGAMQALIDAAQEGWFTNYDWVIRVNPDVIIRDDSYMLEVIQNDPDATAFLIDCGADPRIDNVMYKCVNIHTDFFAIKPKALPSNAFLNQKINAERSFTRDIRDAILNKGHHRWVPGANPEWGICRAGYYAETLSETHVTHFHQDDEDYTCKIPFPNIPSTRIYANETTRTEEYGRESETDSYEYEDDDETSNESETETENEDDEYKSEDDDLWCELEEEEE